jgi:hypothetical protein
MIRVGSPELQGKRKNISGAQRRDNGKKSEFVLKFFGHLLIRIRGKGENGGTIIF